MNRRRIVCAAFLGCFFTGNNPTSALADDVQSEYFPVGALHDVPKADASLRSWYSEHLAALQEPVLWQGDANRQTYRFTWLRSFHKPMSFRLDVQPDGSATLTVKRTSGRGGYDPGTKDIDLVVAIMADEVAHLKDELLKIALDDKPAWLEVAHLDGARWILETSINGDYRVVHRSTGVDSQLEHWCLLLIKLSGIDVGDIY